MRDIRNDLQERVKMFEHRVNTANAYCEKMVKQLQAERDTKVAELKAKIAMATKLLEFENEDFDKAAPTKVGSPKLSLAG